MWIYKKKKKEFKKGKISFSFRACDYASQSKPSPLCTRFDSFNPWNEILKAVELGDWDK